MPSSEDLARRAQLRKERKENQQKAIEQAHDEAQRQATGTAEKGPEPVVVTKAAAAAAETPAKAKEPQPIIPTPAPQKTQVQRKAEKEKAKHDQKRATELQAAKDSARSPEPLNIKKLEDESAPGTELSLHQLNAIAEKADRELRDEGKAVAEAAAKGAYGAFVQQVEGKRNRHARMRAQIAAGEAQLAAAKKAE